MDVSRQRHFSIDGFDTDSASIEFGAAFQRGLDLVFNFDRRNLWLDLDVIGDASDP